MKLHPRRIAAALVAPGLLFATLVTLPAAHAAATAPPWTATDPNLLGTVALYDSTGAAVTSGNNFGHIADFAAASTASNVAGATKATFFLTTPVSGVPTGSWNSTQSSSATTFPNATYPAPLTGPGFTKPVVKLTATDGSLTDQIASYPNSDTTTTGYVNVYELRMTVGGPGIVWDGKYWASDIVVNTATGTWTEVYPVVGGSGAVATSTTLSVSPTSPVVLGTSETISAQVTPSTAVGSVEFFDNTTSLGTATVTSGTASLPAAVLAVGSHPLHAVFTPTDATAYATSTSPTSTYVVSGGASAVATSTTLSVSPGSPASSGATETISAQVTPSTAVGSVEFFDNTTSLGTATVTSGTASLPSSVLAAGTHPLHAVFTPTDAAAYDPSTSATLSYVVNAAIAVPVVGSVSVTGIPKVGYTIACTASVTGSGIAVKYAWKNNNVVIPGISSSKLLLGASYYNHSISCTVTATNVSGSAARTSAGRKVALGAALKVRSKPTLSGTFKYKKTVKVKVGLWTPAAYSYSYQWKRDGKTIAHATKASYKIAKKDRKHKITCTVVAKRPGYASGTATTPSKKVAK